MAGSRGPRLGGAVYRALDGKSDYACTITSINGWECSIRCYLPNIATVQLYTNVKFEAEADPSSAKPGTVYQW
jgi:hypothetical protein